MRIEGTSAMVTGASSGLGAATARLLAYQGAKVALLDLNLDAAQEVAREIGGVAVACDVADAASAEDAVAAAVAAVGTPRILVNCAGISVGRVSLVSGDSATRLAKFERLVSINLTGSLSMTSLVAERMISLAPLEQGERGVIVLTASIAAYEGQVEAAAYAASKGGIVSLTLPLARELSTWGIRANTIAPGYFETPLVENLPEYVRMGCAAHFLFPKRFGSPEEFAALVQHMIENRMLNGETIRLDGGMRLPPTYDSLQPAPLQKMS